MCPALSSAADNCSFTVGNCLALYCLDFLWWVRIVTRLHINRLTWVTRWLLLWDGGGVKVGAVKVSIGPGSGAGYSEQPVATRGQRRGQRSSRCGATLGVALGRWPGPLCSAQCRDSVRSVSPGIWPQLLAVSACCCQVCPSWSQSVYKAALIFIFVATGCSSELRCTVLTLRAGGQSDVILATL